MTPAGGSLHHPAHGASIFHSESFPFALFVPAKPATMNAIPDSGVSSANADRETHACLADMRHGQCAVVIDVTDPRLGARLAARGLVPGAALEVLRGGDPMLIRVEESRWALAGAEAALITVERSGRATGLLGWLKGLALR